MHRISTLFPCSYYIIIPFIVQVFVGESIIYTIKLRKINKIVGISLLAIAGATIYITNYTTALVVFLLSLVLYFIRIDTKKIFIGFATIIIIFTFASNFIGDLFAYLSRNSNNSTYSARFLYLASILSGSEMTSTVFSGDRVQLYRQSWEAFIDSRFIGCWNSQLVGGHSFIIDAIGMFGIFGIFGVIILFKSYYKIVIQRYINNSIYPYLVFAYIVGILFAFINPKANTFTFLYLFPVFAEYLVMEKDHNAYSNH